MDNYMLVWVSLALGVLGLTFGSFAGATVWRLRARQLAEDTAENEATAAERAEFRRLEKISAVSIKTDRSHCLHCGHVLAGRDLVPLLSWLSTGGKCRYCHKPIGKFEPMIELAVALAFVVSFLAWPFGFDSFGSGILFGLWLVGIVMAAILFSYDFKWMLLPLGTMIGFIAVGAMFFMISWAQNDFMVAQLSSLAVGLLILPGLYWLLHRVSRGTWVGNGDYKLALGVVLLLGSWQGAFAALFFANAIGSLIVVIGMMLGRLDRSSRVSFGPFLLLGGFIAFFLTPLVLDLPLFW